MSGPDHTTGLSITTECVLLFHLAMPLVHAAPHFLQKDFSASFQSLSLWFFFFFFSRQPDFLVVDLLTLLDIWVPTQSNNSIKYGHYTQLNTIIIGVILYDRRQCYCRRLKGWKSTDEGKSFSFFRTGAKCLFISDGLQSAVYLSEPLSFIFHFRCT